MDLKNVTVRPLDDYYVDTHNNVVHIMAAVQPENYNKEVDHITYLVESNNKALFTIASSNKGFFINYKRISKLCAKLLW